MTTETRARKSLSGKTRRHESEHKVGDVASRRRPRKMAFDENGDESSVFINDTYEDNEPLSRAEKYMNKDGMFFHHKNIGYYYSIKNKTFYGLYFSDDYPNIESQKGGVVVKVQDESRISLLNAKLNSSEYLRGQERDRLMGKIKTFGGLGEMGVPEHDLPPKEKPNNDSDLVTNAKTIGKLFISGLLLALVIAGTVTLAAAGPVGWVAIVGIVLAFGYGLSAITAIFNSNLRGLLKKHIVDDITDIIARYDGGIINGPTATFLVASKLIVTVSIPLLLLAIPGIAIAMGGTPFAIIGAIAIVLGLAVVTYGLYRLARYGLLKGTDDSNEIRLSEREDRGDTHSQKNELEMAKAKLSERTQANQSQTRPAQRPISPTTAQLPAGAQDSRAPAQAHFMASEPPVYRSRSNSSSSSSSSLAPSQTETDPCARNSLYEQNFSPFAQPQRQHPQPQQQQRQYPQPQPQPQQRQQQQPQQQQRQPQPQQRQQQQPQQQQRQPQPQPQQRQQQPQQQQRQPQPQHSQPQLRQTGSQKRRRYSDSDVSRQQNTGVGANFGGGFSFADKFNFWDLCFGTRR